MKNWKNVVQTHRKGAVVTAVFAAFIVMVASGIVAFRALAADTSTYIICYDVNGGEAFPETVNGNTIITYNGKPASKRSGNRCAVGAATPKSTQKRVFGTWKATKGDDAMLLSSATGEVPMEYFTETTVNGETVYVAELTAQWYKDCYVLYMSDDDDGNPTQVNFSSKKIDPDDTATTINVNISASKDGYVHKGWTRTPDTGHSQKVLTYSQAQNYSDYITTASMADFPESTWNSDTNRYEIKVYAVWLEKITITYTDPILNKSTSEKVDPENFNTMGTGSFATAVGHESNRFRVTYYASHSVDQSGKHIFSGTTYKQASSGSSAGIHDSTELYGRWEYVCNSRYYKNLPDDTGYFTLSDSWAYVPEDDVESFPLSTQAESLAQKVTGRTFLGWTLEPDGDICTKFPAAALKPQSDRYYIEVYAKWAENSYEFEYIFSTVDNKGNALDSRMTYSGLTAGATVTYEGGTVTETKTYSQLVEDGGYTMLNPVATGYAFNEWKVDYVKRDGTTGAYTSGTKPNGANFVIGTFSATNNYAKLIFTARPLSKKFTINPTDISGDSNVVITPFAQEKTVDDIRPFTTPTIDYYIGFSNKIPTRPGYTFGGWSTDGTWEHLIDGMSDGANKSTSGTVHVPFSLFGTDTTLPATTLVDGSYQATLVAMWKKDIVAAYDGNGGRKMKNATTEDLDANGNWQTHYVYKEGQTNDTDAITVLENTNHIPAWLFAHPDPNLFFECWNTEADGSGTDYYPGDVAVLSKDTTFYAQWVRHEYDLTFENVNTLSTAEIDNMPADHTGENKLAYEDVKSGYTVTLPTVKGYTLDSIEIWSTGENAKKVWTQSQTQSYTTYTINKSHFTNYTDLIVKFIWHRQCIVIYEQYEKPEGHDDAMITGSSFCEYSTFDAQTNGVGANNNGYFTNITTYTPTLKENVYYKENVQTFLLTGWSRTSGGEKIESIPIEDFNTVEQVTINSGSSTVTEWRHTVHLHPVWTQRAAVLYHGNGGTKTVTYQGETKTVDVDFHIRGNIYDVEMNSFPSYPAFSWDNGTYNLPLWNTKPDGSGTYYCPRDKAEAYKKYMRSDLGEPEIVYTEDFYLASGQLDLYQMWYRKYTLNYDKNDPDVNYTQTMHSDVFEQKLCYDDGTVPLHELYDPDQRMESIYNNKKYYFLGWTMDANWAHHAPLEENYTAADLPVLVNYVALYDIPLHAASGGRSGNGEGDDSENAYDGEQYDKAVAIGDHNTYFSVATHNYTAKAYGVWAAKPFTLMYINGERRTTGDSTRPRVGSVTMPANAVTVTELTYNDLRAGYQIISEKPTAEGYTFKRWRVNRGNDPDAVNLTATTATDGYVGNVAAGGKLWYGIFNNSNPTMTVILAADWTRNEHHVEYWREQYNRDTGEPQLNTDGTVKTSRICTQYRLPYESEQKVGYNIRKDGETEVYHPDLENIYGKIFGGWKLVAYKRSTDSDWVEIGADEEVNDSGHYDDEGDLIYKDISLLEQEETFYMPDMDLKFVAIYVNEFMNVTYDPGTGFSDAARTQKDAVTEQVRYNRNFKVRYAVNGTAQNGTEDCGFYPPRGYEFDRWVVTCASGRTNYQYRPGNSVYQLREDLTYTATWKPGTFYVNYDFAYNFGDGTKPNDIYIYTVTKPEQVGGRNMLTSYGYAYEADVPVQASPTSYESRLGETQSYQDYRSYDSSKYTFTPWVKTEPADELEYTDTAKTTFKMPDATVRFLGTFDLRRYTVTYQSGDGTGDDVQESDTYKSSSLSVKSFYATGFTAPEGYEFAGWTVAISGTPSTIRNTDYPTASNAAIANLMDDVVYTATYQKKAYSVTYRLKAGTPDPNVDLGGTYYNPYGAENAEYQTPVTVKDGYEVAGYSFKGWNLAEVGGQSNAAALAAVSKTVEDDKLISFTMPAGNVVLEGEFEPIEYTLRYLRNRGSGDDTVVGTETFTRADVSGGYYTFNSAFKPTENADEYAPAGKNGYTFLKWSTARDGVGGTEPQIAFSVDTRTYDVYGQWQNWTYQVLYDTNGIGTSHVPGTDTWSFAQVVGGDALISTEIPEQPGYAFRKWVIDNDGTTKDFEKDNLQTGDAYKAARTISRELFDESDKSNCQATAVAQWQKLYTLHFDLDGGSYMDGAEKKTALADVRFEKNLPDSDTSYTFTAPTLTKENYDFLGWEVKEDGSAINNTDILLEKFAVPTGGARFEATAKAIWQQKGQHTVSYRITGDIHPTGYSVPAAASYFRDVPVTVAAQPEEEGYTFSGWYKDGDTAREYAHPDTFVMPDDDVEMRGCFTAKTYSVEYYDEDAAAPFKTLTPAYNTAVTVGREGDTTITPERDGYRFVGWTLMEGSPKKTDANGTAIPASAAVGETKTFAMPAGTVKFMAQYEKCYKIVYHANGGLENTVPVMTEPFRVARDASVTETLDSTTIPQYDAAGSKKFLWWSASPDSRTKLEEVTVDYTTDTYALDATDSFHQIDVYAVWQDAFTVSYSITGSVLSDHAVPGSFTKFPGDKFHVAAPLAETGYTFSGWHYGGDTYAAQEEITMPEGNVELTGSFTELTYTLHYKDSDRTSLPKDGSGSSDAYASRSVGYTAFAGSGGIEITAPNPVKEGHTFMGWAVAPNYTTVKYNGGDVVTDFGSDRTAVVYAVWQEKSITLTYLAPDAVAGRIPTPVTKNGVDVLTGKTAVNDSEEPLVRAGYTFNGWNLKPNANPDTDAATHYDENADYSFTQDTTLYAEWEPIVYVTLTYDENGGVHAQGGDVKETLPASETGENGLKTNIKNPTADLVNPGYAFDGWNTEPDGSGDSYIASSAEYTFLTDTTLYAQWRALPTHRVTYTVENPDNDPAPSLYESQIPTDSNAYYEGEFVYVKAHLSLKGYTFTGWRYDGVNYPENGSFRMPDADVTLVGKFSKNTTEQFAVKYVSGISEGDPGCTSYHLLTPTFMENRNGTHTVRGFDDPAIHFEREGYEFTGWSLSRGSSGGSSGGRGQTVRRSGEGGTGSGLLQMGDPIDNITSDITLTAQWQVIPSEPTEYTLTYDANFGSDGTGTPLAAQSYPAGTQVEISSADGLSRPNATFVGWNTKSDKTGDFYYPYPDAKSRADKIEMNADITLYAIWETKTNPPSDSKHYRLYYNGNGATEGTPPQDPTQYEGNESVVVASKGSLARTGCTFKEWNTRANGKGDSYAEGSTLTMPKSDVTLYAIWTDSEGKIVPSPGTGESSVPLQIALSAVILSVLAFASTVVYTRRKQEDTV